MVRLLTIVFFLPLLALCTGLYVQPAPDKPVVVLTFDDGFSSIYTTAFKIMTRTAFSFSATHFIPVRYADQPDYVTTDQLREMESSGWETGGHCVNHVNLTLLPPDSVDHEIKSCYNWLREEGLSHVSFAFPSGKYNDSIHATVGHYFKNIRMSHDHHYKDGIDRKRLGYFAVTPQHSAADIIARVEEAQSEGAPLVVIGFHAVLPDSQPPPADIFYCRESTFLEFLTYLKRTELQVSTLQDAMIRLSR
jgi:peptidoglycan/xylan/chitin deacetylase (PgdA/CDA1 family)